MSMAMGHFSFGVGMTTGVLMATGLDRKIKNTEPIRVAGGIFAMIPDAGKFISSFNILHNGWRADLFWLHSLIDKIDPKDSAFASFWLVLFMVVMLSIFWLRNRRSRNEDS